MALQREVQKICEKTKDSERTDAVSIAIARLKRYAVGSYLSACHAQPSFCSLDTRRRTVWLLNQSKQSNVIVKLTIRIQLSIIRLVHRRTHPMWENATLTREIFVYTEPHLVIKSGPY